MHSLKKRLEIESQIHKADNLQIMTDNMELIKSISKVRENIVKQSQRKTDQDNVYKQLCTKYGIKPARSLDDLEDEKWLAENSKVLNLRNPARNPEDDTLYHLRNMREERRSQCEMLKQQLEEMLQEQMQLEQILN